ncbi:hypothetical protein ES695_06410 [Candidatus Atribacteria bacterium 1244-E10-H5-B2]|nr:MAG: hypothetical protein ES695_06410 [Candidatus Atribacteria bacterium 1244-E10-H5-B2]
MRKGGDYKEMVGINNIKLKTLKQTWAFYNWELKKEGLTESERSKYLLALKSIEKIIKEKEDSREKRKHKKFIAYDHREAVFLNKRNY